MYVVTINLAVVDTVIIAIMVTKTIMAIIFELLSFQFELLKIYFV